MRNIEIKHEELPAVAQQGWTALTEQGPNDGTLKSQL